MGSRDATRILVGPHPVFYVFLPRTRCRRFTLKSFPFSLTALRDPSHLTPGRHSPFPPRLTRALAVKILNSCLVFKRTICNKLGTRRNERNETSKLISMITICEHKFITYRSRGSPETEWLLTRISRAPKLGTPVQIPEIWIH